ncbi:hypothetical protein [Streptomyces nigrescens]|uniref:hypothetical protein n=1 Tax=Streptomyces nigrescens TaxID=1920 RepID=UPI0036FE93EC
MTNEPEHHPETTDCAKWTALSVWLAGWRTANNDAAPDKQTVAAMEHLIYETDFVDLALYRHNWRNIYALINAFHDAGTVGSSAVADLYDHTPRVPKRLQQPLPPDPRRRPGAQPS